MQRRIDERLTLEKRRGRVEEITEEEAYDLVYYDAFAPKSQPELWTPEVFARVFAAMRPAAVLTTYCVQGQVRRDLRSVGFEVEKLPGPPGKREITRATKP